MVGVLVEVPVMLSLVALLNRLGAGRRAHGRPERIRGCDTRPDLLCPTPRRTSHADLPPRPAPVPLPLRIGVRTWSLPPSATPGGPGLLLQYEVQGDTRRLRLPAPMPHQDPPTACGSTPAWKPSWA